MDMYPYQVSSTKKEEEEEARMDGDRIDNANSVPASNNLNDARNTVPGLLPRNNKKSSRSWLIASCTAGLCIHQFGGSATRYLDTVSFPDYTSNYSEVDEEQRHRMKQLEEEFNQWSYEERLKIFEKGSPLFWGAKGYRFKFFYRYFSDSMENLNEKSPQDKLKWWSDTSPSSKNIVNDWSLCDNARYFKQAGSIKRHILLSRLNENWGAFSEYVENRTLNDGPMIRMFGNCTIEEILEYLNHHNALGVITNQFQGLDHPKVHSIPLGLTQIFDKKFPKKLTNVTRTQLVMINSNPTPNRQPQIDSVIDNFQGTVNNTYGQYDNLDGYIDELLSSKFVLSPSGQGWDCYRNWEALSLGTIPIIEHYNRQDGWFRTFDGLPVVWVEDMSHVTPALLEAEYTRLSQHRNYSYERLTKEYWIHFIYSF